MSSLLLSSSSASLPLVALTTAERTVVSDVLKGYKGKRAKQPLLDLIRTLITALLQKLGSTLEREQVVLNEQNFELVAGSVEGTVETVAIHL